jgi:hypothetical protein
MFLRNVGIYLQVHTALLPRRTVLQGTVAKSVSKDNTNVVFSVLFSVSKMISLCSLF